MIIGASGAKPSRTADLERKLVHHCSPALAGLKPANMFVYREGIDADAFPGKSMEPDTLNSTKFAQELGICRKMLEPCGVRIEVLARRKTGLLLYAYRPTMLRAYLAQPDVFGYLQGEGYDPSDLSACIAKLHRRICGTDLAATLSGSCAFPHEIGFFLGYPYDDVVGFIENKGENSLCSGCWKVYSRARDAQACFCCYKTCTAAYEDLFDEGVPIDCRPRRELPRPGGVRSSRVTRVRGCECGKHAYAASIEHRRRNAPLPYSRRTAGALTRSASAVRHKTDASLTNERICR